MIEIIPAIDLIEGKCVRLQQGDFAQKKVYSENPLDVAKQFEDAGIRRLHVVDLDGARTGKIANLAVLETIAAETNLIVDFGGGIKRRADVENVFAAGAQIVTVGSLAVKEPETFAAWLAEFGGERILLGADARGGKIAVNGWQTTTEIDLIEFLRDWFQKGVRQAFCTDIAKDGLLQGASLGLYKQIHAALPDLNLIASGGVSSMRDVFELDEAGCCGGVIVGKAIYEGKISFAEISEYQKNAG
jgi:phosphoribosylformimino-5-aminoimidazole carboxamide ribotide isomerase